MPAPSAKDHLTAYSLFARALADHLMRELEVPHLPTELRKAVGSDCQRFNFGSGPVFKIRLGLKDLANSCTIGYTDYVKVWPHVVQHAVMQGLIPADAPNPVLNGLVGAWLLTLHEVAHTVQNLDYPKLGRAHHAMDFVEQMTQLMDRYPFLECKAWFHEYVKRLPAPVQGHTVHVNKHGRRSNDDEWGV